MRLPHLAFAKRRLLSNILVEHKEVISSFALALLSHSLWAFRFPSDTGFVGFNRLFFHIAHMSGGVVRMSVHSSSNTFACLNISKLLDTLTIGFPIFLSAI